MSARGSATAGWQDLAGGISNMGLAWWLASEDMNYRYARTALGPLWNVLGTAAFVGSMGLTFGVIMQQPLRDFLPYLAASMAIWGTVSGFVNDAPTVFIRNASIITAYSLPLSIHVYRMVLDKLVLLFYSLTIFAALSIIFQRPPTWALSLFPFSLAIYFIFGSGIAFLLGVWGARYRDLNHAIQSLVLLFFLLTPIFWNKAAITSHTWIVDFNPFYHLLEVGRGPILGYYPAMENWLVATGVAIATFIFGVTNFAGGRRTVLYWM